MMTKYEFKLVSSLEKVFPDSSLDNSFYIKEISGLMGETVSFQLAYKVECDELESGQQSVEYRIDSPLAESIRIRKVELVPSGMPAYEKYDDNYITVKPGLFPDLLVPESTGSLQPVPSQWRSLWLDLKITDEMTENSYPVTIEIQKDKDLIWKDTISIKPISARLPKQKLIHTEWFHTDCLAEFYQVPVFSERHWQIIGNFMESAAEHGINMLLTPVFTPPLDTKVGGERLTVQLVKIKKEKDSYSFDFSRLKKWIGLCREKGIEYLEICHLFSQWGAKYAPKIMAEVNGREERIFGWETEATSPGYTHFLNQFLPALKRFLQEENMLEHTFFHISDEPQEEQKEDYQAAKNTVKDLLADCKVIDALSSFEMYKEGIVEKPIPCNDHIQPFIEAGVPGLWTYYCCAQSLKVSNRFMAMPSARNRILGVQLYLYRIEGFLHWGFNFYNAQFSEYAINPYEVTDAGGGFPSGDAFLVYPGEDGKARDSIRGMVFVQALQDLRALQYLEELAGRERVEKIIYEGGIPRITFEDYPKEESYLWNLRKRVNEEIQRIKH